MLFQECNLPDFRLAAMIAIFYYLAKILNYLVFCSLNCTFVAKF